MSNNHKHNLHSAFQINNEKAIKEKKFAAIVSVIVGLLVFAGKLSALYLTDSTAVLSDVAESVVHIVATIIVLFSIYYAAKPADKNHPYGHGNIEYFSAGFEGLLIIIAAIVIFKEATADLISEKTFQNIDDGMIIIFVIALVNLILGRYLIQKGKKTNSLILTANGEHILTDSYTTGGVLFGFILVKLTGFFIIDIIIAYLVGINIIFTGYKLIRESIRGLMLEIDTELLNNIVKHFQIIKKEDWIDIHQMRLMKSADKVFLDFHLILPYYYTLKQAHEIDDIISEEMLKNFGSGDVYIHNDYCNYQMCAFCKFNSCSERKNEFRYNVEWNTEKLIGENLKKYIEKFNAKNEIN